MRRDTLLYGAGLALAVVTGVGLGRAGSHPGNPPDVLTGLGVLSVVLLGVAAASAPRSDSTGWVSSVAGLYCVAVMLAEPFLDLPWGEAGVWAAAAWVAPLVVAGMALARMRCWWGAAGAGVFLFASVWTVALNMHMGDLSGFLTRVRT